MNWFKKAREWGQGPPFSLTEVADEINGDPYARENRDNPRQKRKKDLTQDSLGLGSDTHSQSEMAGNGPNELQPNSLTSYHDIDSILYNGEIMDESPIGSTPRPRTTDTGGPGVNDQPDTLGIMDEGGMGSYVFRNPPDKSPMEVILQNTPSRKRTKLNGKFVNII